MFRTRQLPLALTSAAVLLLAAQASAQCRGGMPSTRTGQGSTSLRAGQTPLTGMTPQYATLSSYASPLAQQALLLALQQQQNALLLAQQQLQQQQPGVWTAAPSPTRQAQSAGVLVQTSARAVPEDKGSAPAPATPEEAAARQLRIARTLLRDAVAARFDGAGEQATRMRARAAQRLQEIVDRYPQTDSADRAQDLLAKLGR